MWTAWIMGTRHGALLQLAKKAAAPRRLSKEHLRHDLRKRRPASRNHRRPSGASHSWIFVPHGAMSCHNQTEALPRAMRAGRWAYKIEQWPVPRFTRVSVFGMKMR